MKVKLKGGPGDGETKDIDSNKTVIWYKEEPTMGIVHLWNLPLPEAVTKIHRYNATSDVDDEGNKIFEHESLY